MRKQDEERVTIKRFSLASILPDSIVVVIGKRRSGKSFLVREIMYMLAKRKVPYGKIFSHTEYRSPMFQFFFPKLFIDDELSDEKLSAILDSQDKALKACRKRMGTLTGKSPENNMLLVLDDMMSDEDIWKKSKAFKEIFIAGRHSNLMLILTLQYVLGIPPPLRSNVDYAFLFATDSQADMKKLYENYATIIPTYDMFKKIFLACTEDHGCLVINRSTTSNQLTDKVFYYKANPRGTPPFKFGSKSFWRAHDEGYVSSDDDDDDYPKHKRRKLNRIIQTYGDKGKRWRIDIAT